MLPISDPVLGRETADAAVTAVTMTKEDERRKNIGIEEERNRETEEEDLTLGIVTIHFFFIRTSKFDLRLKVLNQKLF